MELTGNKYGGRDWRKLLATRRGTVMVAAACAVIAAAILIYAANKYRQHVDANGNPETVLVANTLIQKGTSGDAIASEQLLKPRDLVRWLRGEDVTLDQLADRKVPYPQHIRRQVPLGLDPL